MRKSEISHEPPVGSILFVTSLWIGTSSGSEGLARNLFKRSPSLPFSHQITLMNSFTKAGGTTGHISQDEPRVSGESAARQAEFAPRAHSNQRQLTASSKRLSLSRSAKSLVVYKGFVISLEPAPRWSGG
jgi:hypothetical protein